MTEKAKRLIPCLIILVGLLILISKVLVTPASGCGLTFLNNLFNGTGQGFTGGSQANGGVEDYNNAGDPPSDRYSRGWTQCTSGNNYCDTGLSSADAKDGATNLIWSLPCNGSGCSSFSDASPLTYTWDSSGANNDSKTASQLCSSGSHGQSGWSLPHQKQLMQAYIDGSYGNLEATGSGSYYRWSATTVSNVTTSAWYISLVHGGTYSGSKNSATPPDMYVRCVRSAQ